MKLIMWNAEQVIKLYAAQQCKHALHTVLALIYPPSKKANLVIHEPTLQVKKKMGHVIYTIGKLLKSRVNTASNVLIGIRDFEVVNAQMVLGVLKKYPSQKSGRLASASTVS